MAEKDVPATKTGRIHYEDVEVGVTVPLGTTTVSRADIIRFASAFDPQPLHLDEAAAKASLVGGLCASGWHSCAILMRLLCDGYLLTVASLGSPGMEEVRFLKPVFPDDTLSGRITCLEKRTLKSRPGVGLCKVRIELVNGRGEVALEWISSQLVAVRSSAQGAGAAA